MYLPSVKSLENVKQLNALDFLKQASPISADFGNSTYDWESIPNSASGYNSALALINFHCGVSVDMDYGPYASGASTSLVASALSNYFDYAPSAQYVYKTNYSTSDWENLLVDELDNSRPVEYR